MIYYAVVSKNAEEHECFKDKEYGICAFKHNGDLIEIIECIYNISNDLEWIKSLTVKLNSNDVEPIHLHDIIEDEIYDIQSKGTERNLFTCV